MTSPTEPPASPAPVASTTPSYYLAREEQWGRLAGRLAAHDEAGIDSETFGQPFRTSPQHRTRIWCWSLAVLNGPILPRGHRRGFGVVLPREALECPALRAALVRLKLWAHNAPHDEHSFRNEGLELEIADSLQWARVAVPGMRDYGLKEMRIWALGKKPRKTYKQMMTYTAIESIVRTRRERRCVCGAQPCRQRQTSWFVDSSGNQIRRQHTRVEVTIETTVNKERQKEYAVTEMTPEHPLFAEWCDYSRADSEDGIEIVDWLRNRKPGSRPFPWRTREATVEAL